jgi:S-adenosylmethionine-diacylglycerol 3-amino-3-carboxypropyl transferase
VDFSAPQIACLEIRMAAFRDLAYRELLAFLGVLPSDSRRLLYARVRPSLSQPARAYWDRKPRLIERGLIHCGRLESYFRLFRRALLPLLLSKRAIDELFGLRSPAERALFYDREVRQGRLTALINLFFNGKIMGLLGRNRHLFRYVDESIAGALPSRIRRGLVDASVHPNPYLEYLLCGNYVRFLPHYLQPDSYPAIRENIGKITLFRGDLRDALSGQGSRKFDGFNLSDIFEALSVEEYRRLRERLIERANPGARLVYWNMQVPREPDEHTGAQASRCPRLMRRLHASDRVFFYRSLVIEEVA